MAINPGAPLRGASGEPLSIARRQLQAGDQDGALATLHAVRKLAAEAAFDQLAPQYERWRASREDRVSLFAEARLDEEALAVLDEPNSNQSALMAIIVGVQARRGDVDAAFANLDRIRNGGLTRAPEPPAAPLRQQLNVGPDRGAMLPIQVPDIPERSWHRALAQIIHSAAKQGDLASFDRAIALAGQELEQVIGPLVFTIQPLLHDLARAGRISKAREIADGLEPRIRFHALLGIAEGCSVAGK